MSDREEDDTYEEGEEEATGEGENDDATGDEEKLGEEEQAGEEQDAEEQEEEEEEEKDPDMPLNEEIISECLSLLCKTGDGLAHAYVRLDVKDRELTDISILNSYIHLRYVDLSKNFLRDISSLSSLTHILTLKCDFNKLPSAKLDELPYLQIASFNNNRIKSTEGLNHPLLEHLCLSFNEIPMVKGLEPDRLGRLHTLELRGNRLETTAGINLPNLKNLFLAQNKISQLEGLERLEHLATLHLRDNVLENLDGFSENMGNLQYVNIRANNITDLKEVKKLSMLPMLRAVALFDNPIADEDEYRLEVLIALRRLERCDKDEYTEDERTEAQDIYEQRRREELENQGQEEIGSDNEEDPGD